MKLDRLLYITLLLINNDIVSAKDLADKFQVSIRTIYRDIETLCSAGIPVVSCQGLNGGFSIMEEYKLENCLFNTQNNFFIDRKNVKELKFDYKLDKNLSYIDIELKFNPKVSPKALDIFNSENIRFDKSGNLLINAHYPENDWIYSTILSFGKDVKILNPPHLKKIIKEKAKEIIELYI